MSETGNGFCGSFTALFLAFTAEAKEPVMQKTKTENLSRSVNVRLPLADIENLDHVCQRLELERSEVARRALREGLKTFRDVKLSGVKAE